MDFANLVTPDLAEVSTELDKQKQEADERLAQILAAAQKDVEDTEEYFRNLT